MFTEVGRRVYAHCTGVGKALLAQLADEVSRGIVTRAGMPSQTERTITDPYQLSAELAQIRARGYAVDDGEQEEGVRCVAVALPGSTTAALSVSGPASRVTPDVVPAIVPVLLVAAHDLTARVDRRRLKP